MRPRLFVLSAPSGAGKSTLIRRAREVFPDLGFSVSATTRKPRGAEQDGREYHFKSPDEFRRMIDAGELAEWQEIYGNYYGTPRAPLDRALAAGQSVMLDIDVYGKSRFDLVYPDAVGVFIDVPSTDELRRRLLARKTESEADLQKRLKIASDEIAYAKEKGKYEHTIINNDLEKAVLRLCDIIRTETAGGPS